jgi:hypothetical protein
MPKNTRQHLIQELQRAEGNLDWVLKHLSKVGMIFAENERQEAERALVLYNMTEQLKTFIKEFWEDI